jgi:hypothetical protein
MDTVQQNCEHKWQMANGKSMLCVIVLNRYGLAEACLHGVCG